MSIVPLTELDILQTIVADRERRLQLADGGPAWIVVQREQELEEAQKKLAAYQRKGSNAHDSRQ